MKTNHVKLSPAPDPDTIFAQLLQDLPPESADLARTFQAFTRGRKIQTPPQLLRVVLLFAALDYSERAIAANLLLVNPRVGKLSNQAVRGRLAACLPWLQALLPQLIARPALPALPATKRLLALDASEIRAPGTGGKWRLHALLDVARVAVSGAPIDGGENGRDVVQLHVSGGRGGVDGSRVQSSARRGACGGARRGGHHARQSPSHSVSGCAAAGLGQRRLAHRL